MKVALLLLSLFPLLSWSAINRSWEGISHPDIMDYRLIHKFHELPLKGMNLEAQRLWAGDYWALRSGSINNRWYAKRPIGFNLKSPTREEALSMSIPELAALAPTEKFDLFMGRYDYPLKREVEKLANMNAQSWEGICHGWAPASINHPEPYPKSMKNPDGIEIPFGSTDIKALLSYYYAYGFNVRNTHQMGQRCEGEGPSCDHDLNAGAFHIVLSNKLGLEGQSFIIDTQRYREVWNHPIKSYSSTILNDQLPPNRDSAPYAVKLLRLRTEIIVPDGDGKDWQPVIGTPKQKYQKIIYEYDLDIDAYGNIIGGDWRGSERPDFLWLKERPKRFAGLMEKLGELLIE